MRRKDPSPSPKSVNRGTTAAEVGIRRPPAILVAAIGLAWLLAPACGGRSGSAVPPNISSAQAERDAVDGAPSLTSSVRVRFDRPLKFAPRKLPLESLFELSVKDAAGEEFLPLPH